MNKIIILKLREADRDIFEAIKSGKKKVETRAGTERYSDISVGTKIVFSCGNDKFEKEIMKVEKFKTIKALVKKYKPAEINPQCKTEDQLRDMYYSFQDYQEKIKKHGLVVMELK
jgi:ASC-1-like (ASCH) protein